MCFQRKGLIRVIDNPGLPATFFLCLPIFFLSHSFSAFLAPRAPFSMPFQPLAWAPSPSGPLGCDLANRTHWTGSVATCPQGVIDYHEQHSARSQCLHKQCHGKSRSSTFHISSFTRRRERDISRNYHTFPPPTTGEKRLPTLIYESTN